MWSYEKRLQFPVNIKEPNAKLAQVIISRTVAPTGKWVPACVICPSVIPCPLRKWQDC